MNASVFTQVDYREFRQSMAAIDTAKIHNKGYETVIYDRDRNILAIMHAASIDETGRCYPATYYVRNLPCTQTLARVA